MAQVSITKIVDGPRTAAFHIFIKGDGLGDITNEVLVDGDSFDPSLPKDPLLTITRIKYDLTGFSSIIEFDYLGSDTPIWSMSDGQYADVDLCEISGLRDRSAQDGQGSIKLTTSGLGAGDTGSILLTVRKD